MKNKKSVTIGLSIIVAAITFSSANGKQIYPAEILGRDLDFLGLGRLGHVAIANTQMMSSAGMLKDADIVIEVLNENPVGQVNTISNFKSRSKYWGSKYGIADRGDRGYRVLVEANHQRWWCPKYTSDTNYHIGSGVPTTGQILECGTWRCDTYVWWAFYSQGLDTMPGRAWLPVLLFRAFPYFNDERSVTKIDFALDNVNNKTLENMATEELNVMPYEEFQMIMDAPPAHYVTSPSTIQMQLAYDSTLNDVKRGVMIDRLIAEDAEPDLVKKLLELYVETNNVEVKNKIVQGLMLYNQRHRNVKSYINNEQLLLKAFFAELLDSTSLTSTSNIADDGIRGFIDTHSPDEVLANIDKIDRLLPTAGAYSSIMLKYSLVHKSKALQRIYIKSIIKELREANNSDLDSYLFGPLSIGYQGTGKDLLETDSKQAVIDYLKEVRYKYTSQGIKANPSDFHRNTTAPYYFELIKNMGI
ncbi:MAG: hypothetical protein H0U57_01225 [Tatlockia sp.]|nr:hypothetical protein [Tatlockia sp.]